MDDYFIMKKKVDKSTFSQGMSIPTMFHEVFYEKIGCRLLRGQTENISIMIDGLLYKAKLINQGFNEKKYPTHSDILQIRYDGNIELKEVLRLKFKHTYDQMQMRLVAAKVPEGEELKEEYALLFATSVQGVVMLDCISHDDYLQNSNRIVKINELYFENMTDDSASIETTVGIKKVRHLSKAIGNSLKVFYGYRCQICGEFIGEKYGSRLIHAHHIDYFTKSLNNNVDNILVVCPNHHYIIHDCNPVFNRKTLLFEYPNGYMEGLKLNFHI